jgi:RimJ/RimL family protein N-acetyltransferase
MVPAIETERLRLRGHELGDFEACAAMWADPAVVRFIGGKPSSREESWARFLRYAGLWGHLGYGYWAIEERASGRLAGEGGFADFKREIQPALNAPEQGWALAPWAQGMGFATEAVRAMIAWGETHLPPLGSVCIISPENAASIRVAEKVGYRQFALTSYKDAATMLFRR